MLFRSFPVSASGLYNVDTKCHDSVIMVEAGCKFVTEDDIMAAVEFAQEEIKKQCEAQVEFAKACGVEKQEFVNPYDTTELKNIINETAHDMIFDAYHNFDRAYRQEKLEEAKKLVKEKIDALPDDHYIKQIIEETGIDFVAEEFKNAEKKIMRTMILDEYRTGSADSTPAQGAPSAELPFFSRRVRNFSLKNSLAMQEVS